MSKPTAYIFFTNGVGVHKDRIVSRKLALRDAKIDGYNFNNLYGDTAVIPPRCKEISRDEGIKYLSHGQKVDCFIVENSTNESNRLISVAIGVANPADENMVGYLSRFAITGEDGRTCGESAEKAAMKMFVSEIGIEFDVDSFVPEKYAKMSEIGGYKVRTRNTSQSARGNKDGLWTTIIAAAVLIPHEDTEKMEKERDLKNGFRLSEKYLPILDAISRKLAEDPIHPTHSREDIISKAIENYINECMKRPDLREVIESIDRKSKT